MGCDMVVALASATGNGQTLFGANLHRPPSEALAVRRIPGRTYACGETIQTRFLQLPQVRQTCTFLAVGPTNGWGVFNGVNEHRVAVGFSIWESRINQPSPNLLGPELVRLTLERSHGARQAMEVLTDLIGRHGQSCLSESEEGASRDHVFLLADPNEAFAVEAAGSAWAAQEIHEVRAVSDVGIIRQDWYRLSTGLADRAIAEGWWTGDGSKLDFTETVSQSPIGRASALRRWGRSTLLLEGQNGHVDAAFLRRLLADHYEGTRYEEDPLHGPARVTPVCQHGLREGAAVTAASVVAQLPTANIDPVVFWVALGPPCQSVHFPLLLEAGLPSAYTAEVGGVAMQTRRLMQRLGTDAARWASARDVLGKLQLRFDQDVEELLVEAGSLKKSGESREFERLAGSMMQSQVERFEESARGILDQLETQAATAGRSADS